MTSAAGNALADERTDSLDGEATDAELLYRGVDERGSQVLFFLEESGRRVDAYAAFESRFRVALLRSPLPDMTHVISSAARIESSLEGVGTKRTTVVGIGAGAPLAQALAALSPEVVRRLILVNPTARVSPTFLVRCVDRIEMFLPLGLPLRPLGQSFDSRPLLHRIRCPALVLTTPSASRYVSDQASFIAAKIPNARREELREEPWDHSGAIGTELASRLLTFLQVPAKKPQKNRSEAETT